VTGPERIVEALRGVVDPCCRERGISVVDMGLLADVRVDAEDAAIDIVLTSGWCPFQVDLLAEITAAVEALPEIGSASVRIVLDEVWSPERMSPPARDSLRLLPEPRDVADRDAFAAAKPAVALTRRPPRRGAEHDR